MKLKSQDKHTFLKLAEELNELSVEILQAVNKPDKGNWSSIVEEMVDVQHWWEKVKKIGKRPF
jgi:NTP pyrophosphatase (non-canonical NTP hydrolase)